jgi:hypothetical protein
MSILIETRQGGRAFKERLPLGDTELVSGLAKLDGENTTVLTIEVHGNKLLIAGGAGMYTVSAFMNESTWFALVGDDQATDEVSMVIGGQRAPQPVRYIVDGERALKAARFFSRAGNLDEEENWEGP